MELGSLRSCTAAYLDARRRLSRRSRQQVFTMSKCCPSTMFESRQAVWLCVFILAYGELLKFVTDCGETSSLLHFCLCSNDLPECVLQS